MRDGFKYIDVWKRRLPDDEADEIVENKRRQNRIMEPDEMRDREKHERAEQRKGDQ